ncbi:unnamed protein product [Pylaiella littoralis]
MIVKWVPTKPVDFKRVEELLQDGIASGQMTNYGTTVRKLESFIRKNLHIDDSRSVIATCNATISLDVAARSIDILTGKNNKWATSSFTFPPTAQVKGGESVKIVDIEDQNYGLDLKAPSLDGVDGIFVTSIFGNCTDIQAYEEYSEKKGVHLVFDNAACLNTIYNGRSIHEYRECSILSLHQTKVGGLSEGSILFTTKELEPIARRLLNFGIDNASFDPKWHPQGMNGKMGEPASAFILSYLESNFDFICMHHRYLYDIFSNKIKKLWDQIKIFPNFGETPICPCLCVIFNKKTNRLIEIFKNCGIYTRAYYTPLDDSPIANRLYERIICLPCHTQVTGEIINKYIEIIGNFLNES